MLIEKTKETNVSSSNKWQVYNTMPLCHVLSLNTRAPIWKMERKKVKFFSTKKQVYQLQVACVSYLNLIENKEFKEKIDKHLTQKFDVKNSEQTRKTPKQDNTHIVALIMFYKNRESLIFKVLGVVVY